MDTYVSYSPDPTFGILIFYVPPVQVPTCVESTLSDLVTQTEYTYTIGDPTPLTIMFPADGDIQIDSCATDCTV